MLLKDDSEMPDEVHVGDPVTRTIRLQAQGLGFEQLPELTLAAPDGAEIYPDKPDTRTRDDGTWLYGERVRKFAFVPSRPGTLTIPGVSVRWWDTAHDRAETRRAAGAHDQGVAGGAASRRPEARPLARHRGRRIPRSDAGSATPRRVVRRPHRSRRCASGRCSRCSRSCCGWSRRRCGGDRAARRPQRPHSPCLRTQGLPLIAPCSCVPVPSARSRVRNER